tara:strand:+ start:841 stop:1149 length:309 start_codon:yes stop_codon:yes gene_type:complete
MTFWTEEKIKQLYELDKTSLTKSEIGKKLGTTKNAVLGKLFRDKKKTGHNPIANYDRSSNENYYFKPIGKKDCYICKKEFVTYSKFDRFCKSCKTSDYYKHN